ncbi:Ig domain-containing protein [Streptosporangium sp. KLBMP 9127]|nr:Ig domain-containing protein [Streptosporangium sp. KLBMP 9127]
MKRTVIPLALLTALAVVPVGAPAAQAAPAAQVVDMFGRTVNGYGVKLVDWEGYLANPYVELTVRPPQDVPFPVTIDLKAEGTSRLMMDLPSQLTATGATKRLTFTGASDQKTFKLAIHSKRGPGADEQHTLRLTVRPADNAVYEQTLPIRVQQDQKTAIEPTIPITFDYRYDNITGYFSDPAFRTASEEAVKDWFRFFEGAPFDTVAAGAENNHLPGNDWQNTVNVTNNAAYNGMWVYFRGIQTPYSTGYPAANGKYHTRSGQQVPGPLHRSTAMIFEYDEAGKRIFTSLADEDWYKTEIQGSVLDVHGLVMHEYGHAVAFHSDWAGMRNYVATNGANDQDVIAYQGRAVPLDGSYHIPGDQPNWDRLSGQSGGWNHLFPTRRWMLTKLALLVAENAGWKVNRDLTPFLKPAILTTALPAANPGQAYQQTLTAEGGVPFYDWRITGGALPAGLSLDRFTGTLSGTTTAAPGTYSFTVQLRDYDSLSTPVTRTFQLNVGGGAPPNLASAATPSASYTSPWESVAALNDGIDPPSSNDTVNPRWGTWPQTGAQWAELTWPSAQTIGSADVYIFDDGQGVRVPASWRLQYWNGSAYADLPGTYPVALGRYNRVTFAQVNTTRLRVVLQSGQGSVGLLEVKAYGS